MGCRALQLPDYCRLIKPEYNPIKYCATRRIIYNGYKQIASFLIDNSLFVIKHIYTWQTVGQDVPLWTPDYTNSNAVYYYIADGNKNIRAMVGPNCNTVAEYDYNPFGRVAPAGSLPAVLGIAATNPFRFSSEYHDDETNGLLQLPLL